MIQGALQAVHAASRATEGLLNALAGVWACR